jgi:hypothetical protein
MSRQIRILCGVPKDDCIGGILHTDQKLSTTKCHTTRAEAMRCMKRHLEHIGFVQLSPREFVDPDNGYIRILPKRSRFGGRMRAGKGEDGARFEPEEGRGLVF